MAWGYKTVIPAFSIPTQDLFLHVPNVYIAYDKLTTIPCPTLHIHVRPNKAAKLHPQPHQNDGVLPPNISIAPPPPFPLRELKQQTQENHRDKRGVLSFRSIVIWGLDTENADIPNTSVVAYHPSHPYHVPFHYMMKDRQGSPLDVIRTFPR